MQPNNKISKGLFESKVEVLDFYTLKFSKNETTSEMWDLTRHCVKSVRIRSFSGPYFPGKNAGKYGTEKLRIRTLFTQCIS